MAKDDLDSYADYKPQSAHDRSVAEYDAAMNNLKPGVELNLMKKDPTLKHVVAGMGWDFRGFDADPPDLDVCVLLLDKNEMTRADEDFIFYNNRMGGDGSARHLGDSRSGAGDGDDEQIELNLATMPFEIMRILFVLSLYNLDHGLENHNFSMVKNVYFRLVNQDTNMELLRLNLDESVVSFEGTALIVGDLERVGQEWYFHARADRIEGGVAKLAKDCGMLIMQNVQA